MKRIVLLLALLFIVGSAYGQRQKKFIGVVQFVGFSAASGGESTGTISSFSDALNDGYNATQIQVGYRCMDAQGREYEILQITGTPNFSQCPVRVSLLEGGVLVPVGKGIVYDPGPYDLIPNPSANAAGITQILRGWIDTHNARVLQDTLNQNAVDITQALIDTAAQIRADFPLIDSSRLVQDSIIVYYIDGIETDRDTIRPPDRNIYNINGSLTGNRILDGDVFNLTFTDLGQFSVDGEVLNMTALLNIRLGGQGENVIFQDLSLIQMTNVFGLDAFIEGPINITTPKQSLIKLGSDASDALVTASGASRFYVVGTNGVYRSSAYFAPGAMFITNSGTGTEPTLRGLELASSRGTLLNPTAAQTSDTGSRLRWKIRDNNGFVSQWRIYPVVSTTPGGTGKIFSDLVFDNDPTVISGTESLRLLVGGDVRIAKYLNTRNDTLTTTPINFLYTDANGKILSSPLTFSGIGGGGGGSGEANDGVNIGTGAGLIYAGKSGVSLQMRSLNGINGITTTVNGDNIDISGSSLQGDIADNAQAIIDTASQIRSDFPDVPGIVSNLNVTYGSGSALKPAEWLNDSVLTFSTLTPGSILFAGSVGQLDEDNPRLFWNNSTNRFGLNTNSPSYTFDARDTSTSTNSTFATPLFDFYMRRSPTANSTGNGTFVNTQFYADFGTAFNQDEFANIRSWVDLNQAANFNRATGMISGLIQLTPSTSAVVDTASAIEAYNVYDGLNSNFTTSVYAGQFARNATIGKMVGVRNYLGIHGSSTVTDAIGTDVIINGPSTNKYAFLVRPFTGTTSGNSYAFYSLESSPSFFTGNIGINTANAAYSLDASGNTDGIAFTRGTDAQRPAHLAGVMRWNTTCGCFEFSDGANWLQFAVGGGSGEANTSSNAGSGIGLALPKSGVDLPFKSLLASARIGITDNGNDVTFDLLQNGATNGQVLKWDGANWTPDDDSGTTYTFENAITETSGNVRLGGALIQNTTITGGNFGMFFTSTRGTPNSTVEIDNTGTGHGLSIDVGTGFGINVQSSGVAGQFFADGAFEAGLFDRTVAASTTDIPIVAFRRNVTGGVGGVGIGAYIGFDLENNSGALASAGRVGFRYTDVTSGSESSRFYVNVINGGVSGPIGQEELRVDPDGGFNLQAYGTGSIHTGTVDAYAAFNSAGKMIRTTTGFSFFIDAESSGSTNEISAGETMNFDSGKGLRAFNNGNNIRYDARTLSTSLVNGTDQSPTLNDIDPYMSWSWHVRLDADPSTISNTLISLPTPADGYEHFTGIVTVQDASDNFDCIIQTTGGNLILFNGTLTNSITMMDGETIEFKIIEYNPGSATWVWLVLPGFRSATGGVGSSPFINNSDQLIGATSTVGTRFVVEPTGAEYRVESSAISGYNGGSDDGAAVIAMSGGLYAVLQPDNGLIPLKAFIGKNSWTNAQAAQAALDYTTAQTQASAVLVDSSYTFTDSLTISENSGLVGVSNNAGRNAVTDRKAVLTFDLGNSAIPAIRTNPTSAGGYMEGVRISNIVIKTTSAALCGILLKEPQTATVEKVLIDGSSSRFFQHGVVVDGGTVNVFPEINIKNTSRSGVYIMKGVDGINTTTMTTFLQLQTTDSEFGIQIDSAAGQIDCYTCTLQGLDSSAVLSYGQSTMEFFDVWTESIGGVVDGKPVFDIGRGPANIPANRGEFSLYGGRVQGDAGYLPGSSAFGFNYISKVVVENVRISEVGHAIQLGPDDNAGFVDLINVWERVVDSTTAGPEFAGIPLNARDNISFRNIIAQNGSFIGEYYNNEFGAPDLQSAVDTLIPLWQRFGINPLDTLDDYAAIAAALTYLSSKGGGTLELPEGQITTSQAIEMPDSTSIVGQGYGTLIISDEPEQELGIWTGTIYTAGTGVRIANLRIDGRFPVTTYISDDDSNYPQRSSGIELTLDSRNCIVENVWISKVTRHGILVSGGGHHVENLVIDQTNSFGISFGGQANLISAGEYTSFGNIVRNIKIGRSHAKECIEINDGSRDILIDGFETFGNGHPAIFIHDHGNANETNYNITISNGTIHSAGNTTPQVQILGTSGNIHRNIFFRGIKVYSGAFGVDYEIPHQTTDNDGGPGFRINSYCENITIDNCWISAEEGILINPAANNTAKKITIQNTRMFMMNDINAAGVTIDDANEIVVENCDITDYYGDGILISGGVGVVIQNNRIKNNSTVGVDYGIELVNTNTDIMIDGNYIGNDNGNVWQNYGISITSGTSADLKIQNNKFDNNASGPLTGTIAATMYVRGNQGLTDDYVGAQVGSFHAAITTGPSVATSGTAATLTFTSLLDNSGEFSLQATNTEVQFDGANPHYFMCVATLNATTDVTGNFTLDLRGTSGSVVLGSQTITVLNTGDYVGFTIPVYEQLTNGGDFGFTVTGPTGNMTIEDLDLTCHQVR